MTVLHQDTGDGPGGLRGDTSALRVGVWLPVNPSIPVSVSRSPGRGWPDDAPRGAVSTFCAEHGISRKSFYELRKRAELEGPAAVLGPRSRGPKSSPSRLTDEVKSQAIDVRSAQEASGLVHGPIGMHEKLHTMGLAQVPSTASLARIIREAGVARVERAGSGTRPSSAHRRSQVRDLLADRRSLPLRRRVSRRVGRDRGRRHHRGGQGHRSPRVAPTPALGQRSRAEPVPTRILSTPGEN